MAEKVLIVDDEERILNSYRRTLRKEFQIMTALGPETGLDVVRTKGPFAVIVSDMRMPRMNGIDFLRRVEKIAPETVRMMLTGNADQDTAIRAVNEGNVFRFMTKPTPPDKMAKVLNDGIRQYRLQRAEHDLLNRTLRASIQVLIEILSTIDPKAFNRGLQARDLIRKLAPRVGFKNTWDLEIAAMLGRIGQVTVPVAVAVKAESGKPLTEIEENMIRQIPEASYRLVKKIPRLETVADMILMQNAKPAEVESVNGAGRGALFLKIVLDLLEQFELGKTKVQSIEVLKNRNGQYDPDLLSSVADVLLGTSSASDNGEDKILKISIHDIEIGDILYSGLETNTGMLLVHSGQHVNAMLLMRIRNWMKIYKIKEPVAVRRPV